jgi:hypothetical protein
MKQIVVGLALLAALIAVPSLYAQENDHGVVGVYADYFRLSPLNSNYVGVGGRIGFNVAPRVQMEGQMTYNFAQSFTTTTPLSTTVSQSSVTLLRGLFGPKLELGTDHARVFGTVQGGFIRFGVSNTGAVSGFVSSVDNFGDTNTKGALYPGGGAEFYVGPIGLRVDAGDFMYWNSGSHHNLVVQFGPQIKF